MDKNLIALVIAALVMHFNQDMNIMFWIAAIVIIITSLRIADKMDAYGRTERNDKQHC